MVLEASNPDSKTLDYQMYVHAAKITGRAADQKVFEEGYAKGQFKFSNDRSLMHDLVVTHNMRLQKIGEEWLASTSADFAYAENPMRAVCLLVVKLTA